MKATCSWQWTMTKVWSPIARGEKIQMTEESPPPQRRKLCDLDICKERSQLCWTTVQCNQFYLFIAISRSITWKQKRRILILLMGRPEKENASVVKSSDHIAFCELHSGNLITLWEDTQLLINKFSHMQQFQLTDVHNKTTTKELLQIISVKASKQRITLS